MLYVTLSLRSTVNEIMKQIYVHGVSCHFLESRSTDFDKFFFWTTMFFRRTCLALFTGHHPKRHSQTENVRGKTKTTEATESVHNI
jgi:hypothetical protein